MSPLHEIQLTQRIFELREACPETGDFALRLQSELRFSTEDSHALAGALEDRFLSPEEQYDLLGHLDLRGVLAAGSTRGGLIARLAGVDGRDALRHHARHLADGLALDPRFGVSSPLDTESLSELASLLPRGSGASGIAAPLLGTTSLGIYHYLHREDSFLNALSGELRANMASSRDPVLRVRSARVLAETGDRSALAFLRESEAACTGGYVGDLSYDERLERACGLAADGHPAAIRFLQNLAVNPRADTARRARALNYLPPQSLENGSDASEVFRSLAEDPDEPIATRYLLLRLLARAPHPPETEWWSARLDDPSMIVVDRPLSRGDVSGEAEEFSQWNLVLAALGESREAWSADLLLETMGNSGLPAAQRREAMMAYILHEGHGTVPWESFRGVLLAQSVWGRFLSGVAGREVELRLRFPARRALGEAADFDVHSLSSIGKEIVLNLREGSVGGWLVDFRPLDSMHDALSSRPLLPEEESSFPVNRRIFLDGMDFDAEEIAPLPEASVAANSTGSAAPGEDLEPVYVASNETQRPCRTASNTVQRHRNDTPSGGESDHSAEDARGI